MSLEAGIAPGSKLCPSERVFSYMAAPTTQAPRSPQQYLLIASRRHKRVEPMQEGQQSTRRSRDSPAHPSMKSPQASFWHSWDPQANVLATTAITEMIEPIQEGILTKMAYADELGFLVHSMTEGFLLERSLYPEDSQTGCLHGLDHLGDSDR
ncbi:hypothetical protein BCV69DRAFT_282643 [Microstroma glucosiphilum]|uniref:Uncharacterized protein n=1 Tax=Pseudomicrostroma glucosiphilum TaxID=1684307 RepID=A0A316UDK4_9BASI|nr:hypothetical protein BCV69DRAFT_282643 [Pseudomicrostroma glucosiphilum]PWN21145.1 hypothetical protein BCV69DRAFT_282643 [Pseudomicrostroma glucosiphilum]